MPPMLMESFATEDMGAAVREELLAMLASAYGEDLERYLLDAGAGWHWIGRVEGALVSHVMVVPRWLQPQRREALHTAYVELVATRPVDRGRGYASELLRAAAKYAAEGFELAALSPSDAPFYARLGWEPWEGPLLVRTEDGLVPTPDEEVMILRLPRTPRDLDAHAALSVEWRPGEVW